MPKGSLLSEKEKGLIEAYTKENVGMREIGRRIGRSHNVIRNYLADPSKYGKNFKTGRKSKLSPQDKRNIVRLASNSTTSLSKIKRDLSLDVSREAIRQVIHKNPNLVRYKMKKAPCLKQTHIEKRLQFAKSNMNRQWDNIIFSDEKKFNLDGPDGMNGYWRDLRKDERYFSTRNFGGGNTMVWAGFSVKGVLNLRFVSSRMNSGEYIETLEACLLPYLRKFRKKKFVFQQDNAAIHTSRETSQWFKDKKIEVLPWPARSPDLNPVENLWGIVVRKIYDNNKQYATVKELQTAISTAFEEIDKTVLKNLIDSMTNRLFQVINRNGRATDY